MSKSTRATKALEQAGIAFTVPDLRLRSGAEKSRDAGGRGLGGIAGAGVEDADGFGRWQAVCVIVPSDQEVSMKKLAAAFGGKAAQMMKPADAERITGYKVGGISPFGQMKPPRVGDRGRRHGPRQRGLQVRLKPSDAATVLKAIVAPLVA